MKKNQYKDDNPHGYWEVYWPNGTISDKGYYKDGKRYGYWEYYHSNGKLSDKGYYKDGKRHGYCEDYSYYVQYNKTLTKNFHI